MRVVVDCHMAAATRAGDAGNGRYAVRLARALAATAAPGDDAWALVARADAIPLLGRDVRHAGTPANDVRRLLWATPRTLRTLSASVGVFTYVSPLRGPTPTALCIHDASFVTHPEWLSPKAAAMLRVMVPRSAARSDVVLALSHTARAEIIEVLGIDEAMVRVVSPDVDARFRPDETAAARVHERFGVARYCLAVGDVGPRKNLSVLREAFRALDDSDLELVIVGAAGRSASRLLGPHPRMRWLGRVSDDELADLYAGATLTAFPSLHEGFGMPAAEALASGSPLVVSDRGALPEVVGGAALVAAPTPAAFAEAMRAALEPATADRLRAAGPVRAAQFTRTAMGAQAWQALREVAR